VNLKPSVLSPPLAAPQHISTQSRYHLHVRQQPVAARACVAGARDRRPVDPPPIVQLLITDFDPQSQEDRNALQDPRLTVGCLLFPFSGSSLWIQKRDQREKIQEPRSGALSNADAALPTPQLVGKAFMSPFFVDADPDPDSAPTHPSSSFAARDSAHPYPQGSDRGQLP
jgi:hypothetical protein